MRIKLVIILLMGCFAVLVTANAVANANAAPKSTTPAAKPSTSPKSTSPAKSNTVPSGISGITIQVANHTGKNFSDYIIQNCHTRAKIYSPPGTFSCAKECLIQIEGVPPTTLESLTKYSWVFKFFGDDKKIASAYILHHQYKLKDHYQITPKDIYLGIYALSEIKRKYQLTTGQALSIVLAKLPTKSSNSPNSRNQYLTNIFSNLAADMKASGITNSTDSEANYFNKFNPQQGSKK